MANLLLNFRKGDYMIKDSIISNISFTFIKIKLQSLRNRKPVKLAHIFTDIPLLPKHIRTHTQLVCHKLPKMEIIITKCRNFEFQINYEPPAHPQLYIACRSCVFDCVGCAYTYSNKLYVLRSKCRSSLQLIVFLQNISIPFRKSRHAGWVLHNYL